MTTFPEREREFETRFAHAEELRFKAIARANRLTADWAARELGYAEDAAERFADGLVGLLFQPHGEAKFIDRIHKEFESSGTPIGREEIQSRVAEFERQARHEIGLND